ncbi:hypothetical protein [Amycolatopsis sp. NPDC049159]|uniref:hypothetical protein n=1 Tax=unclassified Amycolatopsis TaxID=2618356 RepID=UPI0033CE303E
MRRLLVKLAVVSSGATAALLTLVGGASAAATEPAKVQTTDQVVAELASPDATVSGLLKCWVHPYNC